MRRYHWGFNLQFPKLRLISIILCSLLNIVFGSFTNLLEFHSPVFSILLFTVNILFIIVSCSKIHADNSDSRFLQVSFCCLLFLLALFHGALFPCVLEQLTLMSLCSFVGIWSLELRSIPLLRIFYTYSGHVPTALPVFSEWNKFTLVMCIWKADLQRASLWLQFFVDVIAPITIYCYYKMSNIFMSLCLIDAGSFSAWNILQFCLFV